MILIATHVNNIADVDNVRTQNIVNSVVFHYRHSSSGLYTNNSAGISIAIDKTYLDRVTQTATHSDDLSGSCGGTRITKGISDLVYMYVR